MQKLVINTQHKENYGAHDWDGKGECPQYWKFKGGTTYVLPNFKDFDNVGKVVARLAAFIESSSDGFQEYILGYEVMPHSEKSSESWETETQIFIDGDKITAMRVIDNRPDEDGYGGYMKSEILEQTETWTLQPAGERKDYSTTFLMNDGDIVDGQAGLKEWFEAAA